MQKRKLILTAIFLVGLLAITAASAADNTTGIGIAQDSIEIEMMNEQPSAVESDEILAVEETPVLKAKEVNVTGNTFQDIETAIDSADDGGTVYLDGITYFGNGLTINVAKSINLIGKKGTVLDAQKKSSILYITHDDVVLKDIMFINGDKRDYGGAIYWDSSNAHILNCSFENNTAQYHGGANYFKKALTNSILTGNYNNNTAQYHGGANHFHDTLTNSTITGTYNHNTAQHEGGANHFNNALTNTTITGTYNHNTATNRGGANNFAGTLTHTTITGTFINNIGYTTVQISKSDESNMIKDSIFINNTYNIKVAYGNIKVTNCWFGNNASNYNTDMTNSQGVTIDDWYYLDIDLNDTDATVSLNNIYRTIGATEKDNNCRLSEINMTLTGKNINVPSTQTMKNGIMQIPITTQSNQISLKASYATASYTNAKEMGEFAILQDIISKAGANSIINLDENYTYTEGFDTITEGILITNDNVTINGNGHTINAKGKTRIFFITGKNITLKNITFTQGQADNGGAIYWQSTNVNILDCYFINNTADYNGGANYFAGTLTNTTINGNYTHNTATNNGGANYFQESLINVNIKGNYNNNTANGISNDNGGGANYFLKTLTNTNINGNYTGNIATKGNGGANHFRETLTNTNITGNYNHNTAYDGGGANFFKNTLDHVNIKGNYTHNTAYMGGANYYDSYLKNVNMTGNYTNNTANGNGGANVFWDFLDQVNINGNYNHNSAGDGGANYFWEFLDQVNINGNYTHNTAQYNGGANNFWSTLTNTNINGNYNNNTAQQNGGANHFEGTLTNTNINGNYTDNTAGEGGANYFLKSLINVNITGNYNQNTANGSNDNYDPEIYYCAGGGANYFDNTLTKVNITGNYTQNKAETNGGANLFRNKLTNVTITGNYTGNTANGKLVYLINGIGYYDGGGANYFQETLTSTTITGNYTHNTAQFGGANIFWNLLDHVNINGNYNHNTADEGGANYFQETLNNTNINGNYNNNTASDRGGANYYYNELNNVNINGNYNYNTAYEGGANYYLTDIFNTNINGNYNYNSAKRGGANYHYLSAIINTNITGNYINNTGTSAIDIFESESSTIRDSIFLNNVANIKLDSGDITLINNWFGNNASNYNETPNVENIDLYNWLFLNATVDYDAFAANPTANVTFALYSFNSKTNETSYYDAGQMSPIKLSITANQGKVNQSVAGLGETVTYTPDTVGKAIVTAAFESAKYEIELNIIKYNSSVTIKTITDGVYNTTAPTVDYEVTNETTVSFTINNSSQIIINRPIAYLESELSKLNAGTYEITIINAEGGYHASNATGQFTVYRAGSSIKIAPIGEATYGSNTTIGFTVTNSTEVSWKILNRNDTSAVDSGSGLDNISKAYPAGEYTIQITNKESINYNASSAQMNFTVKKAGSLIVIDDIQGVPYGNNVTVKFDVANATAVTYAVKTKDGKTIIKNRTISNIKTDLILTGLEPGQYTITIANAENANYTGDVKSKDFTITKANSAVSIKAIENVRYKNNVTIRYSIENRTENVTVTVDGVNDTQIIITQDTITVTDLNAGNYTIRIANAGNDLYNSSEDTKAFTVNRADPIVNVTGQNITYGQTENVHVEIPVNATGNVTVKLDGKIVSNIKLFVDGKADIHIYSLKAGNYTVEAIYSGDDNYNPASCSDQITVAKTHPDDEIRIDANVTVTSNSTVEITLPENATGNVTVKVDNKTQGTSDVENGTAKVTIPPQKAGNHTVEILYSGDDNYLPANKTEEITVYKENATAEIEIPTDIKVGDNTTAEITLPEDATGTVTLKVDGKTQDTAQLTNGSANLTIPPQKAGNHTIEIAYTGDDKYNPANKTDQITVSKNNATENIEIPENATFNEDASVNVTLPGDATGTVTLKVDGNVIDTVDVSNGTASIRLPKLAGGNHTAEITYSGDEKYNPSAKTETFTVARQTTQLSTANVTATYKTGKNITITLKDAQGTPIGNATVNVEIKDIKNYTTDENGQINISTASLAPDTYNMKIAYAGNENYTQTDAEAKVVVKKASSKITAKKKTFKDTDKTKKYTITLKDNKGSAIKNAKVTLKVNRKTYTAKTNSKGKATFKLKKLSKKGKYNAAIKFKGNKYYAKSTKKVKLTVKDTFKTVKRGSKAVTTVKKIQKALKNRGYYTTYNGRYLMVDGKYEVYTEMAVKQFQKANGLKVTGSVDYNTAKKLKII